MANNINSDVAGSSLVSNIIGKKVRITAQEWEAKVRDKTECYHKVGHEFGAYLPDVDNVTSWHLRDLSTGVKKPIKGTDMKSMHVPMYNQLSVEEFIKLIKDHPFVQMCLPDREKEMKKMGRQYLINVLYTRLGEKFKKQVDKRVDARHQEVKEEGNKFIELDAEMAELFKASKAVSTSNGTAYHLFKASAKRRRTKLEFEEDKLREEAKKLDVELKLKKFAEMEQQVSKMQEQIQNHQILLNQASSLYDQGLLKQIEDGSWLAVHSFQEQQALLAQRQQEAQKSKQHEQQVNVNPSPQIDSSSKRDNQQLEPVGPVNVAESIVQNNQAKPSTVASTSNTGGNSYRALSRRAAAQNASASKQGKGTDKDFDMK